MDNKKTTTTKKAEKPVKTEKKALSFLDRLKEIAKTFFILFTDKKDESALIIEKKIDITSPVNVLHVFSLAKGITGGYEDYILSGNHGINAETFFKFNRKAKGKYTCSPAMAGYIYHFCERIHIKIEAIRKANPKSKDISAIVKPAIKQDLFNLNKMIIKPKLSNLAELLEKDFPHVKGKNNNPLSSFVVVNNVEKGEIEYITK